MNTQRRFEVAAAAGISMGLPLVSTVSAEESARGKALHDGHCIQCHAAIVGGDGTAIYTRTDRRIDSMTTLSDQVHHCKNSLGVSWPEDQIRDVVTYLNQTFYHFKK